MILGTTNIKYFKIGPTISLKNLIPEGCDYVTRIRELPRCLRANCLPLPHAKPQMRWLLRVQLKCDGTQWRTGGGVKGNWRMEWVACTLHTTSEHALMRTSRMPVVDWTDGPADLNALVRFAERRNMVSARVPSHLKRSLLHKCTELSTVNHARLSYGGSGKSGKLLENLYVKNFYIGFSIWTSQIGTRQQY